MPTALLLANPFAARFARPVHRRVVRILARGWSTEAVFPSSTADVTAMSAEAAAAGLDLVVAMGGDGVIHHAAQGLIGTGTSLGVIAAGTADVFARQLRLPLRPESAAKLLTPDAPIRTMPVVTFEARTDSTGVSRSAVFSLGVGADAAVVEAAESAPMGKRAFGPGHFAAAAMKLVRTELAHHAPRMAVRHEARSARPIGVMAQFRDSYTYFGRIPLRLTAGPPDPMSLLLVDQMRVRRSLAMLRGAAGKKGLGGVRGMVVWEHVDGFSVEAEEPIPVQADGEIIGRFERVTAGLLPDALAVRVPSPR